MGQVLFEKIYSHLSAEDFVGRKTEMEFIFRHAAKRAEANRLLILASPSCGLSELLKQTFDTLFLTQEEVVPIYFSFSSTQKSAREVALDFLLNFLWQATAFRRSTPSLLQVSPTKDEIKNLLSAQDLTWAYSSRSLFEEDLPTDVFLRSVFSVPARAFNAGVELVILFDDVHMAEEIGDEFLRAFCQSLDKFRFPFVLGGRRRDLLNTFNAENSQVLHLNPLRDEEAKELIMKLSVSKNIKINEQTLDLIIRQFQAKPFFIRSLFDEAERCGLALDSYKRVETVTNEMLFSGEVGRYFGKLFDRIVPDKSLQKETIKLLHETSLGENHRLPFDVWEKKLKEHGADAYKIVRRLHVNEIVQMTGADVEVSDQNFLVFDYINSRYRLEVLNEPRALVVGETLVNALKRAPQIMARFYRKSTSIDLGALLSSFSYQEVPLELFDYGLFKAGVKSEEKLTLPQIVYTAETSAFYSSMANLVEKGYSCTAIGFQPSGGEVGWIVVQIDSNSEITRDLAEFWCDRLEIVAFVCGFLDYKIWLIAPDRFTEEALLLLRERNVYSSNFHQIQALSESLKTNIFAEKTNGDEYELVLPMGEDTELIAAHAVEEIARRSGFSPKSINQIKTALIEACINATEHSHSPDRKIRQKFKVEGDKLVITISNRGLKIPLEKLNNHRTEGRRGWGFKLINNLMDEIKLVQTDEGVQLVMVKKRN